MEFKTQPPEDRKMQVIDWLSGNPSLAKKMRNGNGFTVSKGAMVRRPNGSEREVIGYPAEFGIEHGATVGPFNVKRLAATEEFCEKLAFFPAAEAVDAPF